MRIRIGHIIAGLLIVWPTLVAWADQLPPLIDLNDPAEEAGTPILSIQSISSDLTLRPHAAAFGDVNGDGFDDLVAAALETETTEGVVIVWGSGELLSQIQLDPTAPVGYTFLGAGALGTVGGSVACGDFDGDGFDDILLGLCLIWGKPQWEFGAFDLLTSSDSFTTTRFIDGIPFARTGASVAAVDYNGDGIDDLAVSAPFASLTETSARAAAGTVHVIEGTAALRGETVTLSFESNPWLLTRIDGQRSHSNLGYSSAAGDVNGDGFEDLVLGGPLAGNRVDWHDDGEVTVIYGERNPPPVIDLSEPMGTWNETRIHPMETSRRFGTSVACGDMDADGFDEVIAGMPEDYSSYSNGPGEVDVIWGAADLSGQELFIGPIISQRLTTAHGMDLEDGLGHAVACGDIDGDGRDDLLAAAPMAGAPLERGRGALYALHALPNLMGIAIDFSHRAPDVSVLGIWPASRNDRFGSGAVAGGDFNRDGVGEFAGGGAAGRDFQSHVAMVYGVASAETAFANEHFHPGPTARRGIGGRLSPTVGTWVAFDGGSAPGGGPSILTAVVIRSDAEISNLATATPDLIADSLRWIGGTRTGYSSAEVTFQFTDQEIAGLDEETLLLWRAPTREGSWAIVQRQILDTHRNEIRFDDNGQFGFFAITGSLVPPDPAEILAYLLGQTTSAAGLDVNGDPGVDVGDLVWALNASSSP